MHPDPEDENEQDEELQDLGENEDEAAFEDADEDGSDYAGGNGYTKEEPMEES